MAAGGTADVAPGRSVARDGATVPGGVTTAGGAATADGPASAGACVTAGWSIAATRAPAEEDAGGGAFALSQAVSLTVTIPIDSSTTR